MGATVALTDLEDVLVALSVCAVLVSPAILDFNVAIFAVIFVAVYSVVAVVVLALEDADEVRVQARSKKRETG